MRVKVDRTSAKMRLSTSLSLGRSSDFRLSGVVILLAMIALRFVNIWRSPDDMIIPDSVLLAIAFLFLSYLWLQELMDREKLLSLHGELMRARQREDDAVEETLKYFVSAVERKYPFMDGHADNVATYAQAIGRKMNMKKEELAILKRAALLHDIGTSAVPDYILYKREPLSDAEWEEIKAHPQVSHSLLAPYNAFRKEAQIVRHHHERYDGKGYPDRIKAEEIPLSSRIIAVAEAFDAMVSQRSYRMNWLPREFILHELQSNAGSQFDPTVVGVLLDVLRHDPKLWMAPIRAQ